MDAKVLPSLGESIATGATELGVTLDGLQVGKLEAYIDLLLKWNEVYNLTAIRSREQILTHHILDCLAIVPSVSQLSPRTLLDVGAGAGLPGVVLAVAMPKLQVTLIDAVQKKTAFLNQVSAELGLQFNVLHGRVEALTSSETYDCIVSRAFASLGEMIRLSMQQLAPKGHFVAMKGSLSTAELAGLPLGFEVAKTVSLCVPGLHAARSLVVVGKRIGESIAPASSGRGP